MSNPQQETKIELVTEAIEALVLAQVVALREGHSAMGQVVDARRAVSEALRELLTPTLRVVTMETIPAPNARPVYPVA